MQLRAFLHGAQIEITSSCITINFAPAKAFHGKHTLSKFEQLVDLVSQTFGTITLEVITPEERRCHEVQQALGFQPLQTAELTAESPPAGHLVKPAPPSRSWQDVLRQTTPQFCAFLKPAHVHIEDERVLLTYDEKSSFHGKQIAEGWDLLLPIIIRVFGPVTLELITPEITKQVNLKEKDAVRDYLSHTTGVETLAPARVQATFTECIAYLGKLNTSEREVGANQVIGTDPGLANYSTRDLMAGRIEGDTLIPDGRRQLFSVGSIVVWHHRRKPRTGEYELIQLADGRYGIRIHQAPPLQMYVTANSEETAEWSANLENAVRLGTLVQVRTNLT